MDDDEFQHRSIDSGLDALVLEPIVPPPAPPAQAEIDDRRERDSAIDLRYDRERVQRQHRHSLGIRNRVSLYSVLVIFPSLVLLVLAVGAWPVASHLHLCWFPFFMLLHTTIGQIFTIQAVYFPVTIGIIGSIMNTCKRNSRRHLQLPLCYPGLYIFYILLFIFNSFIITIKTDVYARNCYASLERNETGGTNLTSTRYSTERPLYFKSTPILMYSTIQTVSLQYMTNAGTATSSIIIANEAAILIIRFLMSISIVCSIMLISHLLMDSWKTRRIHWQMRPQLKTIRQRMAVGRCCSSACCAKLAPLILALEYVGWALFSRRYPSRREVAFTQRDRRRRAPEPERLEVNRI